MAVFIGCFLKLSKTDGRCLFLGISKNGEAIRKPRHSDGCAPSSVGAQPIATPSEPQVQGKEAAINHPRNCEPGSRVRTRGPLSKQRLHLLLKLFRKNNSLDDFKHLTLMLLMNSRASANCSGGRVTPITRRPLLLYSRCRLTRSGILARRRSRGYGSGCGRRGCESCHRLQSQRSFASSLSRRTTSEALRISVSLRPAPMFEAIASNRALSAR
jgi:hypothetical protein